jgi:type IV secretory pathway ATPase VirB11/archaellum biosynthesis ATPase
MSQQRLGTFDAERGKPLREPRPHARKTLPGFERRIHRANIASISIRAPRGKALTSTTARAGYGVPKYVCMSSLNFA